MLRPNPRTAKAVALTHVSPPPAGVRMDRQQIRDVFKGMVVSQLEAGFLRYSRREKLMRYARQLHIPEFEASLLIAEAQFYSGDIPPLDFDSLVDWNTISRPEGWSVSMRLTFAAVAALLVDLAVIHWLVG